MHDALSDEPTNPAERQSKAETRAPTTGRSWSGWSRKARTYRRFWLGLLLLLVIAGIAILAPIVAPYDPTTPGLASPRSGPSSSHWLGVDALGRDNLSRLIYGSRVSIVVALAVVLMNVIIGTAVGMTSGYVGSWVDMLLMRITDLILCFPLFLVAVAIVGSLSANLTNVVLVLGLLGWTAIARLVRSSVLGVRTADYVEAARAIGASDTRILIRHILPNVTTPILVAATFGVAQAVLLEASLSFLGLGIQPPTPSWGNMLAEAQSLSSLQSMPYLWAPPGFALVALVSAANLIGSGLQTLMMSDDA